MTSVVVETIAMPARTRIFFLPGGFGGLMLILVVVGGAALWQKFRDRGR